jgi:threonine/homoserine/homoserine lactone efflux protein
MLPLHSSIKPGKYVFPTGFLISFLGSLPPGMTNIITIRLATSGDYPKAVWFALGTLVAEVMYAKICSALVNRIFKFEFIVTILQWLVLLIFGAMAVMSFISAVNTPVQTTEYFSENDVSPFILGFVLMIINPVQIPFWLGWATILTEKKILTPGSLGDLSYLFGVGLGSVVASALFIVSGQLIFSFLEVRQPTMHFVFGCLFTLMTLMQAAKLFRSERKIGKSKI